jgi:hypothetical protein
MSMQPLDRPVDSAQILRYRGPVTIGGPSGTYPKNNAEIPSDSLFGPVVNVVPAGQFRAWVRFLLGDATAPTNPLKRLPAYVFDDSNLAGVSPHKPVASVISVTPGINASDLSIAARTWAPNLHIAVQALDAKVISVDTGDACVLLDSGPTSGLGRNTGLPVIALGFNVLAGGTEIPTLQAFDIDITFEVRWAPHR